MLLFFQNDVKLEYTSETSSKINNSNRYSLQSLLNDSYIVSNYLGILPDSKDKIIESLTENINNFLFSKNAKIIKLREKILKKLTKKYFNLLILINH